MTLVAIWLDAQNFCLFLKEKKVFFQRLELKVAVSVKLCWVLVDRDVRTAGKRSVLWCLKNHVDDQPLPVHKDVSQCGMELKSSLKVWKSRSSEWRTAAESDKHIRRKEQSFLWTIIPYHPQCWSHRQGRENISAVQGLDHRFHHGLFLFCKN